MWLSYVVACSSAKADTAAGAFRTVLSEVAKRTTSEFGRQP